jgi:hypothetical protein
VLLVFCLLLLCAVLLRIHLQALTAEHGRVLRVCVDLQQQQEVLKQQLQQRDDMVLELQQQLDQNTAVIATYQEQQGLWLMDMETMMVSNRYNYVRPDLRHFRCVITAPDACALLPRVLCHDTRMMQCTKQTAGSLHVHTDCWCCWWCVGLVSSCRWWWVGLGHLGLQQNDFVYPLTLRPPATAAVASFLQGLSKQIGELKSSLAFKEAERRQAQQLLLHLQAGDATDTPLTSPAGLLLLPTFEDT